MSWVVYEAASGKDIQPKAMMSKTQKKPFLRSENASEQVNPTFHAAPRIGFYSETYLYRSEVFFYRQASGMQSADVQVIARWGSNLEEFPAKTLFLADEFRDWQSRIKLAISRRMDHSGSSIHKLPDYAVRRITRHLDDNPVDLLYCIFGWNAAQLLDVLDKMKRPVPLVFLAAGSDINAAASFGDAYLSRLQEVLKRSSLILCGSDFLRMRLLNLGASPEKVVRHYIGIGIPEPPDVARTNLVQDLRLVAVSRVVQVKGVPHTLRAFKTVLTACPMATLEIIGEGSDLDMCKNLAVDLDISERVRFRGSCSIAEVYDAMRRADIFVQHNIRSPDGQEESISGTMLEASAHGLPVIVTRSGGNAEGVWDDETGILVEPGDEIGMANAIISLARDPERRKRLGAAGRTFIEGNFNVRAQNSRLEAMLTRVALGQDHV